jgi:hypothetical protein
MKNLETCALLSYYSNVYKKKIKKKIKAFLLSIKVKLCSLEAEKNKRPRQSKASQALNPIHKKIK